MSNKDALQTHYHKAVEPALSLMFEISDLKRAGLFHKMLENSGTISLDGKQDVASQNTDQGLQTLLDILDAYGVTIGREYEVVEAQRTLIEAGVRAFMTQDGLSREDAWDALLNTNGGGGLFREGMTRFLVTTPQQTDLMRLHHDLTNLSRRYSDCGKDKWLNILSFRENVPLLLKTLDQSMAYARENRFQMATSGNSYITGLGPEKPGQKNIRVVDNADAFCRPIEP